MAGPCVPLALDEHLCFAVYSAGIAINRAYKPLLDALGITYPQYLVLLLLWEKDGITVGAIADRLALESSTITPLVKRLETTGLVKRKRNPQDERQVMITLTPKGCGLQERAMCVPEALLTQSHMTVEELQSLNGRITALRNAISAD